VPLDPPFFLFSLKRKKEAKKETFAQNSAALCFASNSIQAEAQKSGLSGFQALLDCDFLGSQTNPNSINNIKQAKKDKL